MTVAEELERAELEAAGQAYERRSYANQRFHCSCGRFVRGRTVRFVGYWGRLAWTCTHCGDCHE